MSPIVILVAGWLSLLGVCLFAWLKGGPAERWGGTLNVLINLLGTPLYLIPAGARQTGVLAIDGLMAFAFLFLAVRFTTLWIGLAMLLEATQFLLHTYYFVMERKHDALFAIVNNMVMVGVLISIATGTVLAWRRRSRAATEATAAAPA